MTARPTELDAIEITDGRQYLGSITERAPRRWRAVDANGHRLGEFPTREQARLAVITAAAETGTP